MTAVPDRPFIYHITHVDNLPSIVREGGLWSDAAMVVHGGPTASIGMDGIKRRRLTLPVRCHPGDCVGEYVPFYFCPRSIMLFLLHRGNHPDLNYHRGQDPIIHLVADLREAAAWAESHGRRFAFSLSNAGAVYAEFRSRLDQLTEVDWEAVASSDFRDARVKEGKQAEFLVREFFPWHLVSCIGVLDAATRSIVIASLASATHRPLVEIRREWYF